MKQKAVIFDLDGTLADCSHRRHFMEQPKKDWKSFYAGISEDIPNKQVVAIYKYLAYVRDFIPLFVSGRPDTYKSETEEWLLKHVYKDTWYPFFLRMRKESDCRADAIVKKEIYERDIEPLYEVKLVLDDRDRVVKMWRSLGLECWQVAEGDF